MLALSETHGVLPGDIILEKEVVVMKMFVGLFVFAMALSGGMVSLSPSSADEPRAGPNLSLNQ